MTRVRVTPTHLGERSRYAGSTETDWIEHRRADGHDGLRVRIAEVSTGEVRVKKDGWDDMKAPQIYYILPFIVTEDQLRSLNPLP